MSLGTILLIILVLMLIGAIPAWPHSKVVGLWAERRARAGIDHRDYSVADGAVVTCSKICLKANS